MNARFATKEKVKSKKEIEALFSEGNSIAKYPVRLIYKKMTVEKEMDIRAAVSVSKRNFKKAVDRNRIKRLLRESYRKNKYLVHNNTTHQFAFMFLYTGKKIPEYIMIESKIKQLLKKFITQEVQKNK